MDEYMIMNYWVWVDLGVCERDEGPGLGMIIFNQAHFPHSRNLIFMELTFGTSHQDPILTFTGLSFVEPCLTRETFIRGTSDSWDLHL